MFRSRGAADKCYNASGSALCHTVLLTHETVMRAFHTAIYHGELRHFAPENKSPS